MQKKTIHELLHSICAIRLASLWWSEIVEHPVKVGNIYIFLISTACGLYSYAPDLNTDLSGLNGLME